MRLPWLVGVGPVLYKFYYETDYRTVASKEYDAEAKAHEDYIGHADLR